MLCYVEKNGPVDVLNADFIDAYIEKFQPAVVHYMPYGAHKVPMVGKLLGEMYRMNMLRRNRVGLQGLSGQGFPRWVYVYDRVKEGPTCRP